MKKSYKKLSRDTGLEIGSILGAYFLKLEHLHYGYWPRDLKLDISNLQKAQQNYTEFLISQIPEGVKTILDVGCGTGSTAKALVDRGFNVDCLSPSHFQCERVKQLLGSTSKVFECEYEKLETKNKYDLILFSESFQYINPQEALAQSSSILNSNRNSFVLICDIFRKAAVKHKALRGGHELEQVERTICDLEFNIVKDIDITEETAPNIDLLHDITENVARPIALLIYKYLNTRYPLASKIVHWWYGKQIEKKHNKYFSDGRTGEDFKKSRAYKILLCQKDTCPVSLRLEVAPAKNELCAT